MLEAYDLNAGDVIRVDNGTYNLSANLIVGNADLGVAIEGYHDAGYPDRRALIDRGNTNAGSYAIELQDADRVTLDRLHVIGGYYGVFAGNGARSDDLLVTGRTLYNNSSANISIGTGNVGPRSPAARCSTPRGLRGRRASVWPATTRSFPKTSCSTTPAGLAWAAGRGPWSAGTRYSATAAGSSSLRPAAPSATIRCLTTSGPAFRPVRTPSSPPTRSTVTRREFPAARARKTS